MPLVVALIVETGRYAREEFGISVPQFKTLFDMTLSQEQFEGVKCHFTIDGILEEAAPIDFEFFDVLRSAVRSFRTQP